MNPVELIRQDLGADGWELAKRSWIESSVIALDDRLSVFSTYRIYRVQGTTGQFDFPMLPRCSYGYYAANGREAVRLTRADKEIETILAMEWPSFMQADPVRLASLILPFYDGGIKASHRVLADADDLRSICQPSQQYRLNEKAFAKALPDLGITACTFVGETVVLRAVTLMGWMHDKRNLGIETITVQKTGKVTLGVRQVLATRVFDRVPGIIY
jgi:hypothetical protein